MEFAKSLGADEVIDYRRQDVSRTLKDYDAIFDTAGGEGLQRFFPVLKKGGVVVTMEGAPDQEVARRRGVQAVAGDRGRARSSWKGSPTWSTAEN